MNITSENFEVFAAKAYTNYSCLSKEEFLEDLNIHILVKKLAKKISKGSSKNLRLLTNHIICFTNNFEPWFAKELLLLNTDDRQRKVITSVLLYLGYLTKTEYSSTELDFETLILLKEMD